MLIRSESDKKLVILAVILFVLAITALFLFTTNNSVLAQSPDIGIEYAEELDLPDAGEKDIRILILDIVKYLLTFLGIIAVIMIMYAGWLWMSSGGSEEKIGRAKKTLINAVIGLIIILASYAIVAFIINTINNGLSGTGGTGGGGGGGGGGFGASGNDAIEYHYPARNQADVPRNTKIVITFLEPITASDIISGTNINTDNIKISKTSESIDGPWLENFTAEASADQKTFKFTQIPPYIGSPSEEIWYTVALTNDIHKANGDLLFPGAGGGYDWKFEVSTFIDVTPPMVTSVVPLPGDTEPRNIVIQVNFNEAIDPSSVDNGSFTNIIVNADSSPVDGNLYVSNQYRTVEFLTVDDCGVNTCGDIVYCLPGPSAISVLVKACSIDPIPFTYDGLVDMADNSLDGNKDGTAQGPVMPPYDENNPDPAAQGDSYTWSFNTSSDIEVSAPVIEVISPDIKGTNIALNEPVYAIFDKRMMSSSLNKNSVVLYADPAGSAVYYWMTNETLLLEPKTKLNVNHADFAEEANYTPEINSNAKDIYQNCFNPSEGPGLGDNNCRPDPAGGFPYCCNGVQNNGNCEP